jgi:metallo-beta-lactamase family protein
MKKKPEQTFIIHGEYESSESLSTALHDELGIENVTIPEPLQSFNV